MSNTFFEVFLQNIENQKFTHRKIFHVFCISLGLFGYSVYAVYILTELTVLPKVPRGTINKKTPSFLMTVLCYRIYFSLISDYNLLGQIPLPVYLLQ